MAWNMFLAGWNVPNSISCRTPTPHSAARTLLPTPLLVLDAVCRICVYEAVYAPTRYSYLPTVQRYACVRWYRIPSIRRQSVVAARVRSGLRSSASDRGSRRRTAMNTAVPTDLPYSYSLQVHYGRTMPDAPKRNRKAEYS